jgi:flagellar hook-length control protein FliK
VFTPSNITAIQGSGAANALQTQSPGQTPKGLLGFLEAYIQQMQGAAQGGATPLPGQNLPPGLKGFAAQIADLLKKSGISQTDLQTMSPQDLAAKITALMQQQNITVPPTLQNLTPQDLATQVATQIQQNSAVSGTTTGFQPTLTSDLIAPQSATVQDTQGVPTKDDIAKKISTFLEQQQQGAATALSPAQFHQLKDQIAELQSAPGSISPDTLNQLTTDMGNFLASQGVSQSDISGFLADLTQTLQKDQTASTDTSNTTSPAPPSTTPAIPTTVATAVQPVVQQPQGNISPATSGQSTGSAQTQQITDNSSINNSPVKNALPQGDKAPVLGGNNTGTEADASSQWSAALAPQQQQQSLLPQQQNLTAKIAGFSVNPALINDLANGNSGFGSGSGFGSQGDNAQQSQDLTGAAALLQPATADMFQNQSFTNYLTSASGQQPSPTTQLVNVQLQNNISAGVNTMTLQLEPAELGKMNVRLSFAKDGTVKAHMTVDKPETLALLQKDSAHLQRALQQSGLTTDENSLSFDLRQQGQQHNTNGYNNNGGGNADEFSGHMDSSDVSNALQAQLAIQSSGYITSRGVNIMV